MVLYFQSGDCLIAGPILKFVSVEIIMERIHPTREIQFFYCVSIKVYATTRLRNGVVGSGWTGWRGYRGGLGRCYLLEVAVADRRVNTSGSRIRNTTVSSTSTATGLYLSSILVISTATDSVLMPETIS